MENCYRQTDGGSIGNEITGVVAKTRMIWFINKLKQTLGDNEINTKIAKAFVDDLFLAVGAIKRCGVWR